MADQGLHLGRVNINTTGGQSPIVHLLVLSLLVTALQ